MPALAERLMVGEGLLVQWSLKQTSNTGLGLTLLVEEVLDRSDKLRHFCLAQENLEVVHNVAVTLQSCTKLLAKCAPRLVLAVACSYVANTGMLHASLRNGLVACRWGSSPTAWLAYGGSLCYCDPQPTRGNTPAGCLTSIHGECSTCCTETLRGPC